MTIQQAFEQAVHHHQSGRLAEAEALYRQILTGKPDHAETLHMLGLLAHQTGHHDAGAELIGQATQVAPENSVYQSNLATVLFEGGRLDAAIAAYRRTLELDPDYAGTHNSLGHALTLKGELEEAVAACNRAIALQPDYAMAHNNLGNALTQQGRGEEAIAAYQTAIHCKPDYADAHLNLGIALMDKSRIEEAITACRRAIAAKPDFANAYNILGDALVDARQAEDAVAAYRKAIQISDSPESQNNLGLALCELGRLDESAAAFHRAIQLQPDHAQAHSNLGNTLAKQDRPDAALAAYRRATELQPAYAMAHNNLGTLLMHLGCMDEAEVACQRALDLDPEFAMAKWNRSLLHLLRGDFERGWPLHEARWKTPGFTSPSRNFPQPMWDGSPLAGQRVLIHAEQGFGDSIQFIRYAPLIAERGGVAVVECPQPLAGLFGTVKGVGEVIAEGAPLPPFDLHVPVLSLPFVFGTTLENIPREVPYLSAFPSRCVAWRERLGEDRSRLKVGLAWAGNPGHFRDRLRSIPLRQLLPLLEVEGVDFISLQKDRGAAQIAELPGASTILDPTADLHDFADTAALLSQLDLIIAVDTAIAHLAGALGRPVWTLLPFAPDWRWMTGREDSPWYPTMRLFRQPRIADWDPVIAEVRRQLQSLAQSRERRPTRD